MAPVLMSATAKGEAAPEAAADEAAAAAPLVAEAPEDRTPLAAEVAEELAVRNVHWWIGGTTHPAFEVADRTADEALPAAPAAEEVAEDAALEAAAAPDEAAPDEAAPEAEEAPEAAPPLKGQPCVQMDIRQTHAAFKHESVPG